MHARAAIYISLFLFRDVVETCGDGLGVQKQNRMIIFATRPLTPRPSTTVKEQTSEHLVRAVAEARARESRV
jgi:hypothetical protein